MAKKINCFFLLIMLTISLPVYAGGNKNKVDGPINAQEIPYEKSALNKLGRGLINTATCLAEVPAEAYKVAEDKDPFTGCTLGVVEGFCTAILRGLSGIYDTVTFFIPPYDKPLMQPEYALKSSFEKFRYHKEEDL